MVGGYKGCGRVRERVWWELGGGLENLILMKAIV